MKSKFNPASRQNDLVLQELKGELLIYDLKINKAYCLNRTSAIVWNLCDGTNSVAAIRQTMSEKLEEVVSEDLVFLALDQLNGSRLLENSERVAINFEGLSRREAIRRAGLASVIALPLISSIVAPQPADAQSVAASSCPTQEQAPVGFGGFAGDICRCAPGTPSGTTCGIGGFGNNGECLTGCTCTSNGIEPVGGNFTQGVCG